MDTTKSLIILVLSLLMGACGFPELEYPLHMRLADNAPEPAKQGIRQAAEDWNVLSRKKLGHDIIILDKEYEHESAASASGNRKNDIFSAEISEYDEVSARNWLGICTRQQRPHGIYVDIAFAPERLIYSWGGSDEYSAYYFIALHEFGHAVGLDHVNDPTELMDGGGRPFEEVPSYITPSAIKAFCEVHGCE
jgi:hypothetical protein